MEEERSLNSLSDASPRPQPLRTGGSWIFAEVSLKCGAQKLRGGKKKAASSAFCLSSSSSFPSSPHP